MAEEIQHKCLVPKIAGQEAPWFCGGPQGLVRNRRFAVSYNKFVFMLCTHSFFTQRVSDYLKVMLIKYLLDIFYAHPPTIIIAESNLFMSLWYIMDVYLICFLSCARMSDLKVMHIQYLLDIFYTRTPTIIIHFISFIYSLFLHSQAIYPLPFIMVHYGCLIHLI